MRKAVSVTDLTKAFRAERHQTAQPEAWGTPFKRGFKEKPDKKNSKHRDTSVDTFLAKYADIQKHLDSLTNLEMLYLFREEANQAGFKYVIANLPRDLAMIKKARVNYSSRELANMIMFLFQSEQDYLFKPKLSPTILVSGWCNTVYADSLDWVAGTYSPSKLPAKKPREWNSPDSETKVGEW